jgi:hypothetical protein
MKIQKLAPMTYKKSDVCRANSRFDFRLSKKRLVASQANLTLVIDTVKELRSKYKVARCYPGSVRIAEGALAEGCKRYKEALRDFLSRALVNNQI